MQRILIPVDGSPSAENAVRHVIDLYKTLPGVEIHLLHVQPLAGNRDVPLIARAGLIERLKTDEAVHELAAARRLLSEAGVRHAIEVRTGDPASEIALCADVHGCDAIVMGTRGVTAIENLWMGSVATKVLHLAKVPVTLVK